MGTNALTILTSLIGSGTTLVGIFIGEWLKKRFSAKPPDLSEPEIEEIIEETVCPELENIRKHLNADRVHYWEGSNGEKTLSGYHIKKLSLLAESFDPDSGEISIKDECRLLSASMFSRNLSKLRESSKDYIISDETLYNDPAAIWNQQYGNKVVMKCKVKTNNDRWTGLITIVFKNPRIITDFEVAWVTSQVGRIGNMLKR